MSNTDEIVAYVPFHEPFPTHELVPAENQPQIDEQIAEPCHKEWSGYFEFNPGTATADMTIEVGADDNAYLTIAQFSDTPVNVNPDPNDPNGGGTYRTCAHTFTNVPAGFYYVTISYVNVGGVAINLSHLTVKINGNPMVIGRLDDPTAEVLYNLMKKEDAKRLMNCYRAYQYTHTDAEGNTVTGKTSEEIYAETCDALKNKYGQPNWQNSCSLRVSLAFADYGISLPPEPELSTPNPDDVLQYTAANRSNYVYIRALSILNYLESVLGPPTFTSAEAFRNYLTAISDSSFDLNGEDKPIVIWGEKIGTNHVGMGFEGEGASRNGAFNDAQYIWALYLPGYTDPEINRLQ